MLRSAPPPSAQQARPSEPLLDAPPPSVEEPPPPQPPPPESTGGWCPAQEPTRSQASRSSLCASALLCTALAAVFWAGPALLVFYLGRGQAQVTELFPPASHG